MRHKCTPAKKAVSTLIYEPVYTFNCLTSTWKLTYSCVESHANSCHAVQSHMVHSKHAKESLCAWLDTDRDCSGMLSSSKCANIHTYCCTYNLCSMRQVIM